jgi:thiol-disulfide isomerase/thioredoxin
MLIQKRQLLRALAASGLLSAGATPAFAAAPVVGQPAPNFEATTFTGAKITLLPDLKGKVVLLNFWATWCAPCKTELPLLDHYYSAGKQYGLRMLAVTTEDSASAAELRRLVPLLDMPMIRRLRGPLSSAGRGAYQLRDGPRGHAQVRQDRRLHPRRFERGAYPAAERISARRRRARQHRHQRSRPWLPQL